jgi:hypothetical protein
MLVMVLKVLFFKIEANENEIFSKKQLRERKIKVFS